MKATTRERETIKVGYIHCDRETATKPERQGERVGDRPGDRQSEGWGQTDRFSQKRDRATNKEKKNRNRLITEKY